MQTRTRKGPKQNPREAGFKAEALWGQKWASEHITRPAASGSTLRQKFYKPSTRLRCAFLALGNFRKFASGMLPVNPAPCLRVGLVRQLPSSGQTLLYGSPYCHA